MIQGIESLEFSDQRVFVRVDFNVPLDRDGKITDDSRILASLPTIQYIMQKGGRVILASHLGRPAGKFDPKLSLLPVAQRLSEIFQQDILFPEDCVGDAVKKLTSELKEGNVLLLENLRFHSQEEANDPIFSERLAGISDIYVNDAFGSLHRAHASTVGMVSLVPKKAAGKLVLSEVKHLSKILESPEHPFAMILGGAKVTDKLGVIENLIPHVDALLIGGAMAYTFLRAKGISVGASRVEESKIHQALKIIERAKVRDIPLVLPVDHVIAQTLKEHAAFQTTSGVEIPEGWMGVDIGPKTLELFEKHLQGAKTILWNGPVGAFEISPFDQGTLHLAQAIAKSSAISVVGGGDSALAVKQAGAEQGFTHLSTGGGATLEFLEGKTLPGLKALEIEA